MHYFHNFKGFKDAKIDLSRSLTLLIGRNGSGKSNIIEGVELLAELIKGRELSEISDIMRGGAFEIRGNLQGCFRQGEETFEIGFEDTVFLDNENKKILYRITATLTPFIKIDKQAIVNDKNLLDYLPSVNVNNNDGLAFAGLIGGLGLLSSDNKNLNTLGFASLILSMIALNNKDNKTPKSSDVPSFLQKYIDTHVFDVYPRVIREYCPIGQKLLSRNGSNLSSVLYYLKEYSPDILEKILSGIKQLPEENFISFDFIVTTNKDVLFALKSQNNESINAKLLSDGTLRTLAILTALETVPEGSRIIIEELDNGVHPSRVKLLVDTIWECSHRRNLNVLVTTHNPATLNGLTPQQLDCVVVCHYDPVEKADKLTALPNIPYSDVLLQKGALGDLVTRNVLESYLMPNFEAEQQRKAQELLDLF
jgi:predicted ATPase